MPKKPKNPPLKKVVVTTKNITDLRPEKKPAFAHGLADKCVASAACQASTTCKNMMATWIGSADALDANQKAQVQARDSLSALEAAEPALILAYDIDAYGYATAVQSISQGDVTIATCAGLMVRADPTPNDGDSAVPAEVMVAMLKKTGLPVLEWEAVPGALLYVAQISVDPATGASWQVLPGRGKSRHLPPLVPGQHYLLRVASIGRSGTQSAWSDTVSITGT